HRCERVCCDVDDSGVFGKLVVVHVGSFDWIGQQGRRRSGQQPRHPRPLRPRPILSGDRVFERLKTPKALATFSPLTPKAFAALTPKAFANFSPGLERSDNPGIS